MPDSVGVNSDLVRVGVGSVMVVFGLITVNDESDDSPLTFAKPQSESDLVFTKPPSDERADSAVRSDWVAVGTPTLTKEQPESDSPTLSVEPSGYKMVAFPELPSSIMLATTKDDASESDAAAAAGPVLTKPSSDVRADSAVESRV